MDKKIKILGIAGSLRRDSFNKALINSAQEICPEEAVIEIADISTFPLFNQDLEYSLPKNVIEFKEKVRAADAILFATPEYNYSVPGVLKNAIDWASRPRGDNSFDGKPVGIMSAANGLIGGVRAQSVLRQTFVFLNMHPLNQPQVVVTFAAEKIKDGKVVDKHTLEKIGELLVALIKWTKRLQYEP